MSDMKVAVDPRVTQQLLMAQLMYGLDPLGGDGLTADGTDSAGNGLFGQMLEQLMNPSGAAADPLASLGLGGGTDSLAGLSAVGLLGGGSDLSALGLGGGTDSLAGLSALGLLGGGSDLSGLGLGGGTDSLGGLSGMLGGGSDTGTGLLGSLQALGLLGAAPGLTGYRLAGGSGLSADGGYTSAYDSLISAASSRYGVDPALIKGVIQTESSFRPDAVSSAGAKGLMQLMDGTARSLGVADSFDPAQNIDAGTRFLSYLLRKYDGNVAPALAAYNAGPGTVDQLGLSTDGDVASRLSELPGETQGYIRKVLQARDAWSSPL